jgi:membrane protein required for colicin V production
MFGGFSYLDAALIAIVAISGIVAMYRGLTREVLSILSWVAAAAACVYFVFKYRAEAQQIAEQFHAPLLVAQVAIGGIIFLVVLIVVHLITARISDTVLDSRVGAIDRILGFMFGVARGFVLVVIPYMFGVSLICKDGAPTAIVRGCKPGELPIWVEKAQSLPIISQSGSTLYSIFTRYAIPGLEKQEG